MGLFSKNRPTAHGKKQLIPGQLIARLPNVGQAAFRDGSHVDVSEYYLPAFLEAGSPSPGTAGWESFNVQFVTELDDASARLGGWASPGAFYVAKDFVMHDDWSKESLMKLMDRAFVFLIESGVSDAGIPMFALPRWNELRQARS